MEWQNRQQTKRADPYSSHDGGPPDLVAHPTQLSDHLVKTAFEPGKYANLSDIPVQRFCRISDCIWDLIEATSLGKQSWDLLHLNRLPVARTPHGGRHILSHAHFMFLRDLPPYLMIALGAGSLVSQCCGIAVLASPCHHRLKLTNPTGAGNHYILILWMINEHILEYETAQLIERFTSMPLSVMQLLKRQEQHVGIMTRLSSLT